MSTHSTQLSTQVYFTVVGGLYKGVVTHMLRNTPTEEKDIILFPIIIKFFDCEDAMRVAKYLNNVTKALGGDNTLVTDFIGFLTAPQNISSIDHTLQEQHRSTTANSHFYSVFTSSPRVSWAIYCNWKTDISPWKSDTSTWTPGLRKFSTLRLAFAAMILCGDPDKMEQYGLIKSMTQTMVCDVPDPASHVYIISCSSEEEDDDEDELHVM
ncbi:hypothetical protein FISHEDRAFT_75842 [Fistulina hepatica ATCC 64428]|uniref:Uncharacterized protein n=1 Tax=Fistulina hepatica ATCC 64428 TaxID=1128425 RepID=A0A0D7A5X8_9AGAR|nr:hypothetical protein FISHEDRAFT_75842 [Fistulina hepatica ATCC 64428]